MKSIIIVCISLFVTACTAADEYVVDCSMAQYDYLDAGRGFSGKGHGAQTRSACVTACQENCHDSEWTNLNCLKNDSMGGCSYFVKMTRKTTVDVNCDSTSILPSNSIVFQISTEDLMYLEPIPVSYSVSVPGYTQSTNLVGVTGESLSSPNMCEEQGVSGTPVTCDNDGVCDLTDLLESTGYVPPNPNGGNIGYVYVKLIPTNPDAPPANPTNHLTVSYSTAGTVHAIATTCLVNLNCADCAAAECNWCDNFGSPTASGYVGCGVSHKECESLGCGYDNCGGYPLRSGSLRNSGLVSFAAISFAAVVGLTL